MEFLFMLIAALGGGFFGAAIGANFAFVMVGFSLLAAVGSAVAGAPEMSDMMFNYVSFGPFMGPHVAFAGGVAAAAYAARRGYSDSGKDIVLPLARLGKPDVLLVGALFGGIGYALQQAIHLIPWFGNHTDSVALSIIISAFAVRLIFGDGSLLNLDKCNPSGPRFAPHGDSSWLRYQEKPGQMLTIGAFAGILAAGVSVVLSTSFPAVAAFGNANTLPFAISAITICLLNMGYNVPVTHHMTNIGGLAAIVFYPYLAGAASISEAGWVPEAAVGALIVGAVFGVLAAFLGEWMARFFLARGTTHVDPPAFAIWPMNTVIMLIAALLPAVS